MLVKLIASELTEGEIDFVSLVKHGANRSPFKIVKSEEIETTTTSSSDVTNTPTVGPLRVADLAKVEKDFSSFPGSVDFKENIGAAAFFPSLHSAMEALAESTFNSLNKAVNLGEAAEQIDKNLGAFKKHVNALVKSLPDSVIKADREGLLNALEGSNLEPSETNSIGKEGNAMTGTKISEAVGGDLDGLMDSDSIQKDAAALEAADAKASEAVTTEAAGEQVVETEGTQTVANDKITKETAPEAEGINDPIVDQVTDIGDVVLPAMPEGFKQEKLSVKQFVEGELIEVPALFAVNAETGEQVFIEFVDKKSDKGKKKNPFAPKAKEEDAKPEQEATDARLETNDPFMAGLNLIGKGMNAQNETLEKINETLTQQTETLKKVVETNEEKIKKAEQTAFVQRFDDLDESLQTLNGHDPITKTDADDNISDDVFKGLCPELENLEDRLRSKGSLQ